MACPHSSGLRPELTQLPDLMKNLPLDDRGYPVPWFVEWVHGKPDFRLADNRKRASCVKEQRCWVCGGSMKAHGFPMTKVFVIGPMCGINRISSEPPSHRECAQWSAVNCPFLARPHAKRRDATDLVETHGAEAPGIMLERNPAVTMLWPTLKYDLMVVDNGVLLKIGDPTERPSFYREGRTATRAEIIESVDSGIPLLLEREQPHLREEAVRRIAGARDRFLKFLVDA